MNFYANWNNVFDRLHRENMQVIFNLITDMHLQRLKCVCLKHGKRKFSDLLELVCLSTETEKMDIKAEG